MPVRIVAVAAAALLLVPAASASIWPGPPPAPPAPRHGLPVIRAEGGSQRARARTCSAHAKAAGWVAPVACEQPPKSELLVPLLGG